ncbi:hypothetical protein [Burkholderia ubonensis]|uniref:hypothetical protein n=1 Tax=Burkholderia ubonensis TaxID=101571 RepID=UPI0012F8151D|nr:hypothetical protein [Burkholderia ubonensis]
MLPANLKAVFEGSDTKRQVFIEPTLSLNGSVIRPDMVICNAREVICVLELKYVPRGRADTTKDSGDVTVRGYGDDAAINLARFVAGRHYGDWNVPELDRSSSQQRWLDK